jgi:hypothetical protein
MGVFWALEFGHLLPCAGIVAAPPYPEVAYAYSGAEFNDQFGPAAVSRIARARAEARLKRKDIRRARYQRRHDQWCRNLYKESWPQYAARTGISGTRPTCMILDDPHTEMPTEEQRKSMLAWHEKNFANRAPR